MRDSAARPTPDSFWRSLAFFSLYRLAIVGVLLTAVKVYGDALNLASQDLLLFVRGSLAYLVAAVALLGLLWKRYPAFGVQLSLQVCADVFFLTLLMYASGGQKSGLAVLLLVVVAGAGLVGQGRMTLFFAALASLAMLIEESWRALTLDADPADFVRTGITCIAFFGMAVTAHLLARRVVANEELAIRRGAELDRQLRISERVIRDMADGVLVTDASGNIRQCNPAAMRLLATDIGTATLADVSEVLATRYRSWSASRRETSELLRGPDGRAISVRYLPAEDTSGNALLYIEDLDQAQAQAQQLKLAALGRLTANIAHEIRNPLAAISHAAELLGEEETDPLRLRLARIVRDNSQRLNRLVTEVLELGRRERAQPENIRWRQFVTAFADELALHDTSAPRRVSVIGGEAEFRFDRSHLHRVLWNLVTNALRHASASAGAVILAARTLPGGGAEINIADDGPGVDVALRGQVFEPFFTTHSGGTGLGLYIARELCDANGALLELLDVEAGAHFRITMETTT